VVNFVPDVSPEGNSGVIKHWLHDVNVARSDVIIISRSYVIIMSQTYIIIMSRSYVIIMSPNYFIIMSRVVFHVTGMPGMCAGFVTDDTGTNR
jgi:hypothetical protein